VVVDLLNGLEAVGVAVWASLGRRHGHDQIDVLRFGSLPGRMARGGAAFLTVGPGAVRGWGSGSLASFELAAVQGLELRAELLVFQFALLSLPPLLLQLEVELFELILVLAFRAGDLLVAMEDPACRQAFQVRAAAVVRAAEVVG